VRDWATGRVVEVIGERLIGNSCEIGSSNSVRKGYVAQPMHFVIAG
jgi:hypothetical protein